MTPDQKEEFKRLANGFIEWLNETTNPHAKVIIDCDSAELVEGAHVHRTEEFIKD